MDATISVPDITRYSRERVTDAFISPSITLYFFERQSLCQQENHKETKSTKKVKNLSALSVFVVLVVLYPACYFFSKLSNIEQRLVPIRHTIKGEITMRREEIG